MGLCAPSSDSYLHNWIITANLDHQTLMTLISKTVMCTPKQRKTLMKWTFPCDFLKSMYVECPSSSTSKTTLNKNKQENLRWLTWSQSIHLWWQVHRNNRNPRRNLPQTCGGRKSICLVCIHPTDNFQSHPSKRFSINELWHSKFKIQKSTINKVSPWRWIWRIF